jgi:hypothetical protein
MAIEAKGLIMAVGAIAGAFAGRNTVSPEPVRIVVQRNSFAFVAFIAVLYGKGGILLVWFFLLRNGQLYAEGGE